VILYHFIFLLIIVEGNLKSICEKTLKGVSKLNNATLMKLAYLSWPTQWPGSWCAHLAHPTTSKRKLFPLEWTWSEN